MCICFSSDTSQLELSVGREKRVQQVYSQDKDWEERGEREIERKRMNREGTGTKREQEKAEYTEESCRSKENREIKKTGERKPGKTGEAWHNFFGEYFQTALLCEWTVL